MPRISNLEKIQNEALAKLNTLRNVLDGRTDAAYRRKIFGSTIGKATKILSELNALSQNVKNAPRVIEKAVAVGTKVVDDWSTGKKIVKTGFMHNYCILRIMYKFMDYF